MSIKLSGYRIGVAVLVEMDGVQAWQGLSFHVAEGKTTMRLRDRVLMTVGAVLDQHIHTLAKELDVEVGTFPYRILDFHPDIRVWLPNEKKSFILAETPLNWMTLEHMIFGETNGRQYFAAELPL